MKRGSTLNWLNKALHRMFSNETEQHVDDDIKHNEPSVYIEKKTPFRFPLISDEEKGKILRNEPLTVKETEDEQDADQIKPLYMHKQWQKDRQKPVSSQVIKSEPVVSKKTTTKIMVQSRTFKPTHVPSPVHGFNHATTKPIKELLAKKVNEHPEIEETASALMEPELSPIIGKEKEFSVQVEQPVVIKEDLDQVHAETRSMVAAGVTTMDKPIEAMLIVEDQVITEELGMEQDQLIDQDIPMDQDQLIDQEKPMEQDQLIDQDKPMDQNQLIDYDKPDEKEQRIDQEKPITEKKSSTLPFNVMMLKSDKERLNKKMVPSFPQPTDRGLESVIKSEEVKSVGQVLLPKSIEKVEQTLTSDTNGYQFPTMSFLVPPEQKTQDVEWMQMQASRLIEALSYFQVKGEIVEMVQGPAVTQFEITVGQGTKVSKIRNLADDLKLALAAKDIRIQAPIPGRSSIGIEIPNRVSRPVRISEVVGSETFTNSDSPLEAALGLDLTGKPVTIDLRKMPHGLIAGATGSGKSVCINSLLISLLYKSSPSELKLLLIDPKMVELAPFNHIPHLVSPVITDVKAATAALRWAVEEMERRYQLFAHIGVRDITRYNTIATEKRQFAQKMPYLLIVIDELADLMMMAPTEVEEAICRIAQKARACGIHLVVATQRPSVDVITGLIKANIPTRIAFSVSSQVDSRTILDVQGAERLLGRGDMLYQGNGMSAPIRLQGTYVTDDEMEAIIEHARSQGEPSYLFEQEELVRRLEVSDDQDDLFEEACRFILEQGSASTSLLQRKFHIGYNRAARLVDLMEQHGYVSEQKGSKAREVFITERDIDVLFG